MTLSMLRRVLVAFLFPFLLMACSQPKPKYYVNDISRLQKWFPFLEDGKTTKKEVELKLGPPQTEYEDGRIWTYRITPTPEGPRIGIGLYNLVVVFDDRNILNKHSFLRDL